jgi:4'-phosphopantetheinyl transferase
MTLRERWPPPPLDPEPGSDEVHVWLASLDVPADRLASLRDLLNAEELARADRFLQPHHRMHSAVARGCLRSLLGRYLGTAPQSVKFQFNARGKPLLAGAYEHSGLRFNLSHSHGLALLAFARGRDVGVDIERIRPEHAGEKIADRFFAPAEAARLRSLPSAQRPQSFFECWTRKEAYIKARGQGLALPLDSFQVAVGPGVPPSILCADDEPDASARWAVLDLQPAAGFAGALVVERPPCVLRCWRLNPNSVSMVWKIRLSAPLH